MKLILNAYGTSVDINKCSNSGQSPFYVACMNNNIDCVSWLLKNESIDVDVNLADINGQTPLMVSVINHNEDVVDIVCKLGKVKILSSKDKSGKNAVDHAVYHGHISVFSRLILALFSSNNIDSIEAMNKMDVFNEKTMEKWYQWCQERKNSGLLAFLTKLDEEALKVKNFQHLVQILKLNVDAMKSQQERHFLSINNNIRRASHQSNYLFLNLKKSSLVDISNVVNNGLLKQECGFDDNLLFLSKLINNDKFNQTIANVTKECMSNETKTVKKQQFFRNNLLNSNIWALKQEEQQASQHDDVKTNDGNNNINSSNMYKNSNSESTVFEAVEKSPLEAELIKQKEWIKNEIIKMEKNSLNEWKQLKYSIKEKNVGLLDQISQNKLENKYATNTNLEIEFKQDFLGDKGIQSEYKLNEMPSNNENGFVGSIECDNRGYLTKILTAAHQIDPFFQREMKQFFQFEKFGIKCKYSSAPVKTRLRAETKAQLDYKDRTWPKTAHILDYMRCSVEFDNLSDFLNGYNKFEAKYDNVANMKPENYNKLGCVKWIVRRKNSFSNIKDESWNLSLNSFNYCDIKCNLLVEKNGVRIIAEIQVLLVCLICHNF